MGRTVCARQSAARRLRRLRSPLLRRSLWSGGGFAGTSSLTGMAGSQQSSSTIALAKPVAPMGGRTRCRRCWALGASQRCCSHRQPSFHGRAGKGSSRPCRTSFSKRPPTGCSARILTRWPRPQSRGLQLRRGHISIILRPQPQRCQAQQSRAQRLAGPPRQRPSWQPPSPRNMRNAAMTCCSFCSPHEAGCLA